MLYFLFEIERVATLRGQGPLLCPGIPLKPPPGWDPRKAPVRVGSRIVVQCSDGTEIRTTIAGLDYPPSGPPGREAQAILVRIEDADTLVGAKVYLEAEDTHVREVSGQPRPDSDWTACVTVMSADDMERASAPSAEAERPSWDEIEAAIQRLDGARFTLVVLGTATDAHMAIGGGKDNGYVSYVTFGHDQFHNLRGPTRHDTVSMVCGGQLVTYRADQCCDLTTALTAAKTFYESGALDGTVEWASDDSAESLPPGMPVRTAAAEDDAGWSGQMPLDLLHTISVVSRCLILSRGLPLKAGEGRAAFHYLDREIVTERATGLRRLVGLHHRQPLPQWLAAVGPKTKDVWLQWSSSGTGVPEQWQIAQFAGCTPQRIVLSGHDRDCLLQPSWKTVRRRLRNASARWCAEYFSQPIEHAASRCERPPVEIEWFRGVVEATLQVAQELDLNEFVPTLHDAIAFARSDAPTHPMFRRLLDERVFLPEAGRLLDAVARAWIFGTFGAWNDQRFDDEAQRRTYNAATARLWEAYRSAVLSAVNRLRREAPNATKRTETEK